MFRVSLVLLIVTTVSWMAFILIVLSQAPEHTLFVSSGYMNSQIFSSEFIAIGAHLGLFGILGVFLYITICDVRHCFIKQLDLGAILLIGGGWGVLTELFQLGVLGRYASSGDVIADLFGVLAGVLLTRSVISLVTESNYKYDR